MRITTAAIVFICASLLSGAFSSRAIAQTQAQKEDAKWIMERISGVKWAADSDAMKQAYVLAAAGNRAGIADLAAKQSQFLNITVKNFALKMSTRDETIRLPLNDFTATIIGVTRDGTDARELLYGNFLYMPPNAMADTNKYTTGALQSQTMYEAMDDRKTDFGSALVRVNSQKLLQGEANGSFIIMDNPDPAGVLTSRTFMGAHGVAGTNRRLIEYTFREFMCMPIDQWADASVSDVRIGRDVDRFPGGDHARFQTTCKACHNMMDPFRGAFAKWSFENESAVHSSVRRGSSDSRGVMNKYNQNASVYPGGYITTDDSWFNNATQGMNAATFGWRGPANVGTGAGSFGQLIANSQRFSTCMAKRVFESVCRKNLSESELSVYQSMGAQFEASSYNMKKLFLAAALNSRCK